MIPEELEKQIWQARRQVRGEKERMEGKCMQVSGCEGEIAGREYKQSDPFLGAWGGGTEERAWEN